MINVSLAEPLLEKSKPPSIAVSAAVLIGSIIAFTAAIALSIVLLLPPSIATLGLLAYCFGCRHGVDADHIAAIDGVTRKLIAAGQRPMLVGLFFSLGHCVVVFAICGAIVLSTEITGAKLEEWSSIGSAVGPWVAAAVLLCIGALNLCVVRDLLAQWRLRQARGHEHEVASLVGRCCPSLIAAIDRPWKVSVIGLLFGLGLDTATEIGLLTRSAVGRPEAPRSCALLLPLLFAAGMALVDTLNGLLMLWAYEWASDRGPMGRLYFSLFLTGASAALALAVGAAAALGQLATQRPPAWVHDGALAPLWAAPRWLSGHFELVGLGAVGVFLVAIVCAVVLAPTCTPSQKQIAAEEDAKASRSLREYVQRGEYVVRFE